MSAQKLETSSSMPNRELAKQLMMLKIIWEKKKDRPDHLPIKNLDNLDNS